jgi:hypothetical protein
MRPGGAQHLGLRFTNALLDGGCHGVGPLRPIIAYGVVSGSHGSLCERSRFLRLTLTFLLALTLSVTDKKIVNNLCTDAEIGALQASKRLC